VKATRNLALDLLRGLAALGVAVYHFLSWNGIVTIESLGTFGVYLFFVLSGLTMMIAYAMAFSTGIAGPDLVRFFVNRVARLIPLLAAVALASLIYSIVIGGAEPARELVRALLTGSGLMALNLPGFLSNSVGAWSLGIEMLFYLVFPVAAVLVAGMGTRAFCGLVAGLAVAQQAFLFLIAGMADSDPSRHWHYYTSALVFAPFFLAGMGLYRVNTGASVFNLVLSLLLFAAVALWSLLFPGFILAGGASYLTLSLAVTLSVLFAYRARVPRGVEAFAEFMGNISYALYLTHWISHAAVQFVANRAGLGVELKFILFIILAPAVAHVTFVMFERPARNRIRIWAGGSPA
jgi:peptidoglycan/LPS O-acetylase OafA/YrhL